MEDKNLKNALEILSKLITGEEIGRDSSENAALYEEYTNNAQVYEITNAICKNLNLSLFEYQYALYASAGENNRFFGYSNEELKKEIGVRLNKELYLCYFIIYIIITRFYHDTITPTYAEYVKIDEIIQAVDSTLSNIISGLSIVSLSEIEENSFKTIALLWEEIPVVVNEETTAKAARGSKYGFVKKTLNFLVKQDLCIESEGRFYKKKRFSALVTNYFEEYKGRLYEIMKGEQTDATH